MKRKANNLSTDSCRFHEALTLTNGILMKAVEGLTVKTKTSTANAPLRRANSTARLSSLPTSTCDGAFAGFTHSGENAALTTH